MRILPQNFWIKSIFFTLIILIGLALLYAFNVLIIPMTLGFLLAFLIEPIINHLEGHNISRLTGITLVFSLLSLFLVAFLIIATPMLIDEVKDLKDHKEEYLEMAANLYSKGKTKLEKNFPKVIPWHNLETSLTKYSSHISTKWMTKVPKLVAGSMETLMSFLIIIPLMVFFILKDGFVLKKWLIQFVPNRYFELTMEVIHNINQQTGAFIRGQIADSLLNAIMISGLLFFVGLPYYLIVGVFAGVANAIPFVGPLTAGSTAVLISILTGESSPVIVALTFLGAHLIDVMFIYPKTVGHSLNLHEMVVILGIIVGGHVGGIIGMLVVIPLIGIVFQSTRIMFRLLKGYNII